MTSLDGRVAVVTGASKGLGAAVAQTLWREGATVVLSDVDDESAESVIAGLDGRRLYVHHDVADPQSWPVLRDRAVAEFGQVDILVNNAGVCKLTPIVGDSFEAYQQIIAINQTGTFLGMQTFLPDMVKHGRGAVVNVASVDATRGTAGMAAYCASKHAVLGMTRAAALELAPTGVRVNCVCPGVIKTPMLLANAPTILDPDNDTLKRMLPMGRAAEPAEIAEIVIFLASDRSSYCSGAAFVADGAWATGLFQHS
jgi:3alpha(or 20beta)-hydroxysteroid dehydrogenase